ncbi:cytochrome C [Azonexus sp.]|uniref:cytochrome C n=1 Tax=Azonexus sp. TaxID=1872668 RepID=UPI0028228884|nr:cytochrome C [Azonexus sp.]MDR1994767.1 cytochrome C [Azonexus sp.]
MRTLAIALFSLCSVAAAEDARQLATLPAPAQEVLRLEMLDNMAALNEILSLLAADQLKEAAEVAETRLGLSTMGRHRDKPFEARPGPHMPPAMHGIGIDGHRAASEFAAAAKSGDRAKTIALLPNLTGACVACHSSYRIR